MQAAPLGTQDQAIYASSTPARPGRHGELKGASVHTDLPNTLCSSLSVPQASHRACVVCMKCSSAACVNQPGLHMLTCMDLLLHQCDINWSCKKLATSFLVNHFACSWGALTRDAVIVQSIMYEIQLYNIIQSASLTEHLLSKSVSHVDDEISKKSRHSIVACVFAMLH